MLDNLTTTADLIGAFPHHGVLVPVGELVEWATGFGFQPGRMTLDGAIIGMGGAEVIVNPASVIWDRLPGHGAKCLHPYREMARRHGFTTVISV
jgi:hypothetical protein